MKCYLLAETESKESGWVPQYVQNVTRMVEQRGGRFLARTSNIERLEGDRPILQIIAIIEWPSKEAAKAFYSSDEYRPYRQSRMESGRNEVFLVASEDITKTARIPE